MIIYSCISEIDPVQWSELIADNTTASFFQTPECYHFYASLSFLKPFVYGVSENDKLVGVICGYIIADGNIVKQFFSRRAIVPGGLLLDENISDQALKLLLNQTKNKLSKKVIYIELRNFNDYSKFRSVFESGKFSYQPHFDIHIDTSDKQNVLTRMSESKRRQIKHSEKAGIEYLEAKTVEEVHEYYKLLKRLYETKIKLPLFPVEFFEKIMNGHFGKILIQKFKGDIIGGMVCVTLTGRCTYEWFVCGIDTFSSENVFSSVVATWSGIDYAIKNDIQKFDFMGAGSPDKEYGVRKFKSKFGGKLVENGRFLYICKSLLFVIGKWAVYLFRKI